MIPGFRRDVNEISQKSANLIYIVAEAWNHA